MNDAAEVVDARVPLMIGAIGHRDLVHSEVATLGARVRDFLESLQQKYPDLRVTVLTSLADGADRLVADVAGSLSMPVVHVLPMPSELYERDFDAASLGEYRQLLTDSNVLTLPLLNGATADDVTHPSPARDRQYAQLGCFIAAHCHILLALWDGNEDGPSGGTAAIIRYHQDDFMLGLTDREPRSRLDDTDDESDLVYHVVCSRDREDGAPIAPLRPGEVWWLSRNDALPRTAQMPGRYEIVLRRMVEFSRDAMRFRRPIERAPNALLSNGTGAAIGAGERDIAAVFGVADWLSLHYRELTRWALRVLLAFALLASICFLAYSDLPDQEFMIYPYLGFMAVSIGAYWVQRRGDWQRRYLDYRVLAEALRVQFYWAVARVDRPAASRFGHDAFLKQHLELGWIRNLLRVAGRRDDASDHAPTESGIEIASRDWIGDDEHGQLHFYSGRWPQQLGPHRVTEALERLSFGAGLLLAASLAFAQWAFDIEPVGVLLALMGLLPIVATLFGIYAQQNAVGDQILQYQFMTRVMRNARRQLRRTTNPNECRRILRELGDAALREHSQWILRKRERPISTVT
jgi:hypothetical protein